MKYLCLVYLEESNLHAVPDSECRTCGDALRRSGHHIAAEALQSVHTATTVRVRNGKVSVTDGPFAETKEQLAGFYLIDAKELKESNEYLAKRDELGLAEIALMRQRERVAELRKQLPKGGIVQGDVLEEG